MSIEQYRKRFFNLMESTIGDVKPLLTESLTEDQKKEYKAKWTVSDILYKSQPAPKYLDSMKMYQSAISNDEVITEKEDDMVVDYYNKMVQDGKMDNLVMMYDNTFKTTGNSSEIGSSDVKPEELSKPGNNSYSLDIKNSEVTQGSESDKSNILARYNKLTEQNKKYEFCKKAIEGEICLVEVNTNDSISQKKLTSSKTAVIALGYTERDSIEGKIKQDGQDMFIRGSILTKV